MTREQETRKEELKATIAEEIDKYYIELSTGLRGGTTKMSDIERMLGEAKAKFAELMQEGTGETITNTDPSDKKKSVQSVKEKCADTENQT